MAFVIADRVRETSVSTGTGNFTLDGAVTGYQTFDAVLDSADTTYYTIAAQGGSEWEVGIGTFTAPATLGRTIILSSSNGGSIVTFSAGTKDVFISLPASKTNVRDQPNIIEVNSSSDALRITQNGTGNALVVEDSSNPDATPFVVDAIGNVGIGTFSPGNRLDIVGVSTSQIRVKDGVNATAYYDFGRDGTDGLFGFYGAQTTFSGYKWSVSAGTEAMRIDALGNTLINTTTAVSRLTVNGDVSGTFFVNPNTVSVNYTIPTNYNAMTSGPISINSGVTVTVPSGSTWTVV